MSDEIEVPANQPDPPYVDPDTAPAPDVPQVDDSPKNDEVPETDPEHETAGGNEPNA